MTKTQLANKKAASAGLDRLVTGAKGREVDVVCIPDSRDLCVINNGLAREYGAGYTAIIATCRNDGTPENIREALELMIASLGTAQ